MPLSRLLKSLAMLHSTNFTGDKCYKDRHEVIDDEANSAGVFIVPCNQTSQVASVVSTITKALKYSVINYIQVTLFSMPGPFRLS